MAKLNVKINISSAEVDTFEDKPIFNIDFKQGLKKKEVKELPKVVKNKRLLYKKQQEETTLF